MSLSLADHQAAFLESVLPHNSENTLKIHRAAFRRLNLFCAEYCLESVAEFSEDTMAAFDLWLQSRGLAPASVYRTLGTLKIFLRWSYRAGLCLWDGVSYRSVQPKSPSPVPPTVAVMARILELPDQGNPLGIRDLFVLELLYGLGLRRLECCSLNLSSLDLGAETLFVVGKFSDQRLLPVGPRLKKTAWLYSTLARPKMAAPCNEKALLLGDEGRRLDLNALSYIVKKYGARLGLKLSPHQLRHACATHLAEAGMRLGQIQQILGHRRIDSTERYVQISRRELKRDFLKSHPRARAEHSDD